MKRPVAKISNLSRRLATFASDVIDHSQRSPTFASRCFASSLNAPLLLSRNNRNEESRPGFLNQGLREGGSGGTSYLGPGLGGPRLKGPGRGQVSALSFGIAPLHCNQTCLQQKYQSAYSAEVESRTQGSRPRPRTQKNPRPRTAFPRTYPLEAKDRNARGQGPRTQPQMFSKKKDLQKSFSGNLQFMGVPRIFDWGGLNHK